MIGSIKLVAQNPGDPGNFDVRGNVYSGTPTTNIDDWFQGATGFGLIDETNTALYTSYLTPTLTNTPFIEGPNFAPFQIQNGVILYDAIFGRDYLNLNSSGLGNDQTSLTGGSSKNGNNPSTDWVVASTNVLAKNDIVDIFAHVRRDGTDVLTSDMWLDMALTTFGIGGARFVDFELYKSEIAVSGSGFTNSGTDEGHSAWTFDASGNIVSTGDLIVGFEINGPTVQSVELRIWVSKNDFNNITPTTFNWGASIDGSGNNSTYGYAQIIVPASTVFSSGSTATVTAPPWGTLTNANAAYSTTYPSGGLAEVGLNLTALGIDPSLISGGNPCDPPFTRVMVKSRTSASFTSSLKDFAGPYAFLGNPPIDVSITDPGPVICTNETLTLSAANPDPNAYYEWTTSDGLFDNGTQTSIGSSAVITQPGTYTLSGAPIAGCTANSNSVTLIEDNVPPTITCPTPTNPYNVDSGECDATLTFAATPSDNCPDVSVAYSIGGSAITFPYDFPVGTTTVLATATDTASLTASCSFDVTVVDNIPPTITCDADVSVNVDAGECFATVSLNNPTTSDNCGVNIASLTNNAPATFPSGVSTTVTWTVTDIYGNSASCDQIVTVEPCADLSLIKTVDKATPQIGEIIVFELSLTNSGPESATGVQVEDILPTGLVYIPGSSTIPAGTTYNEVSGIWDLSSLTITNGSSYTLQIAALVTPACGELTNTAQIISSNEQDPDSTVNNGN